jgi:MobA-like NTP transferase domain
MVCSLRKCKLHKSFHSHASTLLRGPLQEVSATAPSLVVLAAGLGSRFGGDKQFTALGPRGEALMDYAIFDAVRAGITRVLLIVRPEALAMLPSLQRRYGESIDVSAVAQRLDDLPAGTSLPAGRTRPWGTAHAIRAARPEMNGPFIVVNGDDFYGAEPYRTLVAARRADRGASATWHLAGFRIVDTLSPSGPVNRAVCRVEADGTLAGLSEVRGIHTNGDGVLRGGAPLQRIVPDDAVVSMNMWGLTPEIFDVIEPAFKEFLTRADLDRDEYYLPEAIADALGRGRRVQVLPALSRWCGVTFPEDADLVRAHLAGLAAGGEYPAPLWP